MKYSIAVSSLTGNGKLLADQIYKHLGEKECVYFGGLDDKAMESDIIYLGFWTDQGTCDKNSKEFLSKIHNKKIFLFGSAGFGLSQDYFDSILKNVASNVNDDCQIIGQFICQGKMQMRVKEKYLKAKQESNDCARWDALIKNFDEGQSHPDDNDFKNLIAKL